MTQKNGRLTFTILSISLLTVMAGAAMAPALGVIRSHFADQSSLIVQLIASLPALTIITNLFFPHLVGVIISILFLLQAFASRKYQAINVITIPA